MKSRAFLLLFPLAALVGCNKPSDPAAPLVEKAPVERAVASGGNEITAAGVSLTFPKDWKVVNLSQGDLADAMKGVEGDPRSEEMKKAVQATAQAGMIKMFVFDPKGSKPGFMNNVNVAVQSGIGNATLDQALNASKQQMAAIGATATTSKVNFPAGEFGRIESHAKGPNGKPYTAIAYAQVQGGDMTVVTFSCLPEQAKAFDDKAQSIMKTFKRA